MTLPVSGRIGLSDVDKEIGTVGQAMSLGWVRSNSYYAYKDLGSIHGLTWFKAVSSKNSITRTTSKTVTNCVSSAQSIQAATDFTGSLVNCTKRVSVNCNQCGYDHGTYLQMNCNCNCNCAACNCRYTNCNCANCSNCTCTCSSGGGNCNNTCVCTATCTPGSTSQCS